MAIGDSLKGTNRRGARPTQSSQGQALKSGLVSNKVGNITQPGWYIAKSGSEVIDSITNQISSKLGKRLEDMAIEENIDRGAEEQQEEFETAEAEGRSPEMVKANQWLAVINPNVADAFNKSTRSTYVQQSQFEINRASSEIYTEVINDPNISVENRADAYKQKFDKFIESNFGDGTVDASVLQPLINSAETIKAQNESKLIGQAVAIKRSEQFQSMQSRMNARTDDLLAAANAGEDLNTHVIGLVEEVRNAPQPTTVEEAEYLNAQRIEAEQNIRRSVALSEVSQMDDPNEIYDFADAIEAGEDVGINFESTEERAEVVSALTRVASRREAAETRGEKQIERGFARATFALSRGNDVNLAEVEQLRALAQQQPELYADELQDLEEAIAIKPYVQSRRSRPASELRAEYNLLSEAIKDTGGPEVNPLDAAKLDVLNDLIVRSASASARGDEVQYTAERTETIIQPADEEANVDDPDLRDDVANVSDNEHGRRVDFYTQEERVRFADKFNSGTAEERTNMVTNIVTNLPEPRRDAFIQNMSQENMDLAIATELAWQDDPQAARVSNMVIRGSEIEDPEQADVIQDKLRTIIDRYIPVDEGTEAYTRAAFNLYKATASGQTMPRDDMIANSAMRVLGLKDINTQINGVAVMPFEYNMTNIEMNEIWKNTEIEDFRTMNNDAVPVIENNGDILELSLDDVRSAQPIYLREGTYGLVLPVQMPDGEQQYFWIRNPTTGDLYKFVYSERLRQRGN